MKQIDYLVVGAGPTGLGAAYQLKRLGVRSFLVLEAHDHAGGLSSSFKDGAGFTWDVGGHVLFSGNVAFAGLMDELMGEDLICHERMARVRVHRQWTDYPFQDHVQQLGDELAQQCRDGLRHAPGPGEQTHSFKDWIRHSFGNGISELFMEPYNRKVWAYPLERMGFQWVAGRVSPARENKEGGSASSPCPSDSAAWGPNSRFRYPRDGGMGAIFRRMADRVKHHILFQHEVIAVDPNDRLAMTRNGRAFRYKALLNTSPLDGLIKRMIQPDATEIHSAADRLRHNSVSVVGIGVDVPGDRDTSWMYFPDPDCPFYRLTHLHNYAPSITPKGRGQSALMTEIALPGRHQINQNDLVIKVIDGLINNGQLRETDRSRIISTWHIHAGYGYPIPTLTRDDALAVLHPFLERQHIYSRGRFGGWKYEVGNMDHCLMQGVEWADRMVTGTEEKIYRGLVKM